MPLQNQGLYFGGMSRGPNLDTFISAADRALRAILAPPAAGRSIPPQVVPGTSSPQVAATPMTVAESSQSAALMRVNHVGEICAQALYQAQKLATRSPALKDAFEHAAREEEDHLAWTSARLRELDSRPSLLNPLWYGGAFLLGAAAGALGDRWNLAFLAETERQVEEHLTGPLERLSAEDARTRAVFEAMRSDEATHRQSALALGAAEMPEPLKLAMRAMAKVMTTVAYRL